MKKSVIGRTTRNADYFAINLKRKGNVVLQLSPDDRMCYLIWRFWYLRIFHNQMPVTKWSRRCRRRDVQWEDIKSELFGSVEEDELWAQV
jgi:hypothetical protein